MKRLKEIFIMMSCVMIWVVILSAWTYTLKTNTPADGDDPGEADDRMREIKAAFVERLDVDHYFTASATSTYDATDTGKHRYITFREPNSIVSVAADEAILFTKDVNSTAELHYIDEDENEIQITSDGYIYGNSLKALSVLTAAIADANITLGKMAANSVSSDQYVDASIKTVHVADANITAVKLANFLPTDYTNDGDGDSRESTTFSNGMIIKSAHVDTDPSTNPTVTFGTAFPNGIVAAVITGQHTGAVAAPAHITGELATSGFAVNASSSMTGGFNWIAIGY